MPNIIFITFIFIHNKYRQKNYIHISYNPLFLRTMPLHSDTIILYQYIYH